VRCLLRAASHCQNNPFLTRKKSTACQAPPNCGIPKMGGKEGGAETVLRRAISERSEGSQKNGTTLSHALEELLGDTKSETCSTR
jgi:hypothetical protein